MTLTTAECTFSVNGPAVNPVLARNLDALGSGHGELVNRLMQATPPPDLQFADTPQHVPAVTLAGRPLCSKHRPLEEAQRLVDQVDLVEHAVVVVYGFGAGYHVQRLAEQMKRAGVVVVFEPDIHLLRGIFERIDCSSWISACNLIWITDVDDRAGLAAKLDGAEAIVAQGVAFLEHPASRQRLGDAPARFSEVFRAHVASAKTTLMTTLMRSVDTVRNLLHNIDHYTTAGGVADLQGACAGQPAVVVSAGPSLHQALHELAQPGVRDRCVIIAVQTTLQPLLEAGIRPHFVTALDYHEISRRFYERLRPEDVADVTLIVEPKAHPVILDAYPGPVRCCASPFLDQLLGELKRDLGSLPAGATVAHLALYVGELLGCNPIGLVGQDLGFTDGLYYAPGIAIEDVWAPELGPFNTIEMMQWQRIVRHRVHLQKLTDTTGRSIYSDAQMMTYRRQFERDFARLASQGVSVIDTSRGIAKQHTTAQPLSAFLEHHAVRPVTPPPPPDSTADATHIDAVRRHITSVRQQIVAMEQVSRKTIDLLVRMLDEQHDQARMNRHFEKIDAYRQDVEQRMAAFDLLNHVNQLGVFKRLKADRRLHMTADLAPLERQRAELERDLENVRWIADAAAELQNQLIDADRILAGQHVTHRPAPPAAELLETDESDTAAVPRTTFVAALIPVDPHRNGLLRPRSLECAIDGRSVLQCTLERIGTSALLKEIVLLVPDAYDVEPLIDRQRIALPIVIERCGQSPYPPEHEAIAVARAWSETCWRGGITGVGVYDELLCPQHMHAVMQQRGHTAALLLGPDWPAVDVTGEHGCDAVIQRHLDYPKQNSIVFTQAPPGICGCVVSAHEMDSLAQRNRLATIGARLTYHPSAPQADPIAKDLNVQIPGSVRRAMIRLTADSPQRAALLADAMTGAGHDLSVEELIQRCEQHLVTSTPPGPQHLIVELTTRRRTRGLFARHPFGELDRPDLDVDVFKRTLDQFADAPPTAITFDGVGDALLHENFDACISAAKQAGIAAVHVRTELRCDRVAIDRLVDSGVDVVSIDLHADRAATYQAMLGADDFKSVLQSMDVLLNRRRRLTPQAGLAAMALPWIVPRLQRCPATYEDIDSFFDRWQHALGTAVLEGRPTFNSDDRHADDELLPAVTPRKVIERELMRRMTILSDGSVPVDECDLPGATSVGNVRHTPVFTLWTALVAARRQSLSTLNLFRP